VLHLMSSSSRDLESCAVAILIQDVFWLRDSKAVAHQNERGCPPGV